MRIKSIFQIPREFDKTHFLTCFLALMFIRIIESKTANKILVETLIDILKDYNFQHFEGKGYVSTNTRNEMTDLLHESFDFRIDYQIVSEKNYKKDKKIKNITTF